MRELRLCQRWRSRRDSYRPAGEPIRTDRYEVAAIADDSTPKAFVQEHHYSGSYPAARFRFGLFERGGALAGVAVFGRPMNDRALTRLDVAADEGVELSRFVLLDSVAANGETWFLGQCFAALRAEVPAILSFADPVARTSAAGATVFPGHLGTIYQAHNGRYLGRSTARTLRLLPDGAVISPRSLQKIRAMERGWRYAAALLELHGAAPLAAGADSRAWLREWLPRLTRPLRHPGNHRYLWPLDRALRRAWDRVPATAYPKLRKAA